jgi:hypothetical protein
LALLNQFKLRKIFTRPMDHDKFAAVYVIYYLFMEAPEI